MVSKYGGGNNSRRKSEILNSKTSEEIEENQDHCQDSSNGHTGAGPRIPFKEGLASRSEESVSQSVSRQTDSSLAAIRTSLYYREALAKGHILPEQPIFCDFQKRI